MHGSTAARTVLAPSLRTTRSDCRRAPSSPRRRRACVAGRTSSDGARPRLGTVRRLRDWFRTHPRVTDALIALLLTAFTIAGGVLNAIGSNDSPETPPWAIPVVAVLAIATYWRRTRTIAVFVAVTVVSAVLAAAGANDAINLPGLVMLYTVASRRSRRAATYAWLATLAVAGLLVMRSTDIVDYGAYIAIGALVTVPYAIGIAVGNRRQLLAALRDRAERAETEVDARTRVATLEERAHSRARCTTSSRTASP